jgi:hypothetical protein
MEFAMKLVLGVLSLTVLACSFAGCGGAPQGSSDAANSAPSEPAASGPAATAVVTDAGSDSAPAANVSGPSAVVAQFYEALRKGNDVAIAGLLTDKAREETSKSGLGIQSQASESLSYEIRETEYVSDQMDGAHVRTMWLEPSPAGQLATTEVIWVLRKQRNGWKISGMATPVVEGELPLLFNFEEPEDMLQKKEFVERQLAAPAGAPGAESSPRAATAPASPAAPGLR